MIGIPLAWAYGHVAEWAIHRWVLHGAGKKRGAPFSFHFHEHHRASRTNNFIDPVYQSSPFQWNAAGKETLALGLLTLAHIPLLPVAPWFTVTLFASGVQYYRVHKRSHLDTDWAREHIPWHYDHHMGPDQDANWGVRSDWVDRLLGTRAEYAGTEKEAKDRRRRERRAQPAPAPEGTPETPRRAA